MMGSFAYLFLILLFNPASNGQKDSIARFDLDPDHPDFEDRVSILLRQKST